MNEISEMKVMMVVPVEGDPFRQIECNVVDRSHSENTLVVELPAELSHAPASTAPKEVIEKYARDLRMHNETRPLANTREKQEETLRAILTRFLSEARGDGEPVAWMYDFNNGDEDDSFLAFTDDADIPGHIGKITKKTPLYKTTDRICEWRIQPFPDGSGSLTFRTCLGKDHLGTLCGNPDGFQDRAKYCENCGGKIVASALKGGGK